MDNSFLVGLAVGGGLAYLILNQSSVTPIGGVNSSDRYTTTDGRLYEIYRGSSLSSFPKSATTLMPTGINGDPGIYLNNHPDVGWLFVFNDGSNNPVFHIFGKHDPPLQHQGVRLVQDTRVDAFFLAY